MMEQLRRKDQTVAAQKNEIEKLYIRVKEHVLIQDQLYKDYITLERNFDRKEKHLKAETRKVGDKLLEE